MDTEPEARSRPAVRKRANEIKSFRCKNLIAVIENPTDVRNIGTVIRNVNALGVEKVYVVDQRRSLPDDWQEMRDQKSVSKTFVSAVKWTFVRRFDSTAECIHHLENKGFKSIVTSPHVKRKQAYFFTRVIIPLIPSSQSGLAARRLASATLLSKGARCAFAFPCLA